jgi:Kef-type K+ transport system membrane component KefB
MRKLIKPYLLLVGLPLAGLIGVIRAGRNLTAPVAEGGSAAVAGRSTAPLDLAQLVLQICVVLAVSRLTGMLFKRIRQPQVVGEMLAGILLGPSLFGWLAPELSKSVFPAGSLGYLSALSQVGLVLFMFVVGVSLNTRELSEQGHAAVLTSHVSIVTPFFLGSALALFLYPQLSHQGVSFLSFSLFMGAAMSITAFPVLARILAERNLLRSRMGTLSIACAAIDDITGWCILGYIVVLIRSEGSSTGVWVMIGSALAFMLVLVFGVKRLLPRFETSFRNHGRLTENALSLMVVLAMASALITEWIGIHLVFGAFAFGAVMPKTPEFIQSVQSKLESVTVVVLLPLFFAYSGLRTSIGMVQGRLWIYAAAVIVIAIAGKFGGSMLAARMAGIPWRDAASLGILMNTRGLMELVVLNIGLDIGVISQTVFTIMVLMALVTTFMTSPLLEWVYPSRLMSVDERAA